MLMDYLQQMNQIEDAKLQEFYTKLQAEAESQKDYVLRIIKNSLPVLWEANKSELEKSKAAFLNNGEDNRNVGLSGFGAPGIVFDGILFAVYRNSYCYQITVAVYRGTEPAEVLGNIMLEGSAAQADARLSKILRAYAARPTNCIQ